MNLSKAIYPILWWIIILFADAANFRQNNKPLIFGNPKKFFGIILPVSVLYWLYFELANFYFPQWYYLGVFPSLSARSAMAFLAFGTVIPIIIEIIKLLGGPIEMENYVNRQFNFKLIHAFFFLIGIIFAATPFFSDNFLFNQGIWLAPFLILLPLLKLENFSARFSLTVGISGLISGFLWELLNFWAGGKWKYLILPDNFRFFEMPLLGYLGFIPFAFSTLAVYLAVQQFIKPRTANIIILYFTAIVGSAIFANFIV